MTDILQHAIIRFQIYEPVVPLIKKVMQHMRTTQIIDLCSGSSGPWGQMQAHLQEQQESATLILTDKYPNLQAFKKLKERFGNKIQYVSEAVDAMNVPAYLKGMRTIFSSFHHFEPDAAKKILQDTVNQHSAIGIFEFTERRLDKLIYPFLTFPFVFILTPFIRPLTFKMIFWVYIIPIIPWLLTCDGIISYFNAYSPRDLNELVRDIDATGYVWEIGQIASRVRVMKITYLLGFPQDPIIPPKQLQQDVCL